MGESIDGAKFTIEEAKEQDTGNGRKLLGDSKKHQPAKRYRKRRLNEKQQQYNSYMTEVRDNQDESFLFHLSYENTIEVVHYVADPLVPQNIINFGTTCRWANVIFKDDYMWKMVYARLMTKSLSALPKKSKKLWSTKCLSACPEFCLYQVNQYLPVRIDKIEWLHQDVGTFIDIKKIYLKKIVNGTNMIVNFRCMILFSTSCATNCPTHNMNIVDFIRLFSMYDLFKNEHNACDWTTKSQMSNIDGPDNPFNQYIFQKFSSTFCNTHKKRPFPYCKDCIENYISYMHVLYPKSLYCGIVSIQEMRRECIGWMRKRSNPFPTIDPNEFGDRAPVPYDDTWFKNFVREKRNELNLRYLEILHKKERKNSSSRVIKFRRDSWAERCHTSSMQTPIETKIAPRLSNELNISPRNQTLCQLLRAIPVEARNSYEQQFLPGICDFRFWSEKQKYCIQKILKRHYGNQNFGTLSS